MHDIEPYYSWRNLYIASEDPRSPLFDSVYSEFTYTDAIYDYLIHPQWDNIGSSTLYIKILYCDYMQSYCIIEMIGEWNDLLHNDIMFLYRNIIEPLTDEGIKHFILIGENVLNIHIEDNDYYQEWFDSLPEDGWIICMNFRNHVLEQFSEFNLDYFLCYGGEFDHLNWRTFSPQYLFQRIGKIANYRLNP